MNETRPSQMAARSERHSEKASRPGPSSLVPPVDIYENEEGIILLADMPGVTKDGLEVEVEKNILTIKGTIEEMIPANIKPLYAEFGGKDYQRAFTLGPDVDISRIEAKMTAGVLRLVLPKQEAMKPKKIEVKVE